MKACVSLWSANLLSIGCEIDRVDHVVDGYHVDVFDGHNVPELLFGPDFVSALRSRTRTTIDVHLNVFDPDYWAQRFIDVGADMVTVQSGATTDVGATLRRIRTLGAIPSLGLEVHESPIQAAQYFALADRILLMGTAIGIRGVDIDTHVYGRVRELVRLRSERLGKDDLEIYVDGGIRKHTVANLALAGADGVIPGSLVFGAEDPASAIAALHDL